MLFVHALRPDRFLAAAHLFICTVFGAEFTSQSEGVLDLLTIVEKEVCITLAAYSEIYFASFRM